VVKHRYLISFLLTTLLYLLLVGAYFYALTRHFVSEQNSQETVIRLSLATFAPEVPSPVENSKETKTEEKIIETESEAEPDPLPETEEPKESEPEPDPLPEETEESKEPEIKEEPAKEEVTHETVIKKIPIAKPTKKIAPKPKKKLAKKRRKVQKKREINSGGSPRYSTAEKNKFLAEIRRRINRAKSYPRIAQRRGIQGTVKVRFTILANGQVGNISLSGPRVFYASARKAIKSAFPVNVKKAPISLPVVVNLSLHYKLR